MRTRAALIALALLGVCGQGQLPLPERPKIGIKVGLGFSSVDSDTRTFFNIGGDVGLPLSLLGGSGRGDFDYFKGPESSQTRFGLSEIWKAPISLTGRPYAGVGLGFLFDNKRDESDRTVLSLKLFGGFEFGKDTFVEAGVLQSDKTDNVFFDIGIRF